MNAQKQYGIACPGEPCVLRNKPETHSHMPPQELLPGKLVVGEDARALADIILKSYTGLAGDEDKAWEDYEFERLEREMESSFTGVAIGSTAVKYAQAEGQ